MNEMPVYKTCWDGEGQVNMSDVLDILHDRCDHTKYELLSGIAVAVKALQSE